MATCKQLSNLGASQCGFPLKVARRLIFVPLYDKAGNKNGIPLTTVNQQATWDALIADDPSSATYDALTMIYPLPNMENVEDVRADTEFFEWNSGQKARIRQGVRTFTGAIPNETPALLGELQSWEGVKFGVYIFDADGNVIGVHDKAGSPAVDSLLPIPVDGNSFDAKYVLATYTDPLQIMVQFDYAQDFNDKNIWMIPMGGTGLEFDGRTDLKNNTTIHGATTGKTVPSLVITLALDMGVAATGFVGADFKYWDANSGTGGAWVAVDDTVMKVAEAPDGTYTFSAGTTTPEAGDYVVFVKAGYTSYTSEKLA